MNGVNFINYAVLGIPTLFLLDRDGIVLEKNRTGGRADKPDRYAENAVSVIYFSFIEIRVGSYKKLLLHNSK